MKLYVDGKLVDERPFRTQSGHYALTGEGLCVGYDSSDPVSRDYKGQFPFTGGTIERVVFESAPDAHATARPQPARGP